MRIRNLDSDLESNRYFVDEENVELSDYLIDDTSLDVLSGSTIEVIELKRRFPLNGIRVIEGIEELVTVKFSKVNGSLVRINRLDAIRLILDEIFEKLPDDTKLRFE